jgi:hypothetical protein
MISGMRGHVSANTLMTFPIKVPSETFRPAMRGFKYFVSSITIGNSITTTSSDCFQPWGEFPVARSVGNHPAKAPQTMVLLRGDQSFVLAKQFLAHARTQPRIELIRPPESDQRRPIVLFGGGGRLQIPAAIAGELRLGAMNLASPFLVIMVLTRLDVGRNNLGDDVARP